MLGHLIGGMRYTKINEQQTTFPILTNRMMFRGYGFNLKKGRATSLIETWDGNESGTKLGGMGHIFEWFYGGIA